jgi:hypothetical protein
MLRLAGILGATCAALLVAGCGLIGPSASAGIPSFATAVETSFVGGQLALIVTPWPLDKSVAFLCVDKPGGEFTVAHPVPAASAQCVSMDVSTADDRLTASLGADQQSGIRVTRPVFLAVAGSRGPLSAATVVTVVLLAPSRAPS